MSTYARGSVTITQPYIPGYRVALFEELISQLAETGLSTEIYCGSPELAAASSRSEVKRPAWAKYVPTRSVTMRGVRAYYRLLPRLRGDSVAVITELAAGNLNAWRLACSKHDLILFGHGDNYTTSESQLGSTIERSLCRRSAHILTYTERGRDAVIRRSGIAGSKVTAFRNTVDTSALQLSVSSTTDESAAAFVASIGFPPGARCALFLGALEAYKDVDFLCAAAERAFTLDPRLRLIVAGDGPMRPSFERLSLSTGKVAILGHRSREELGVLARSSEVLLNPGRIGLVAVDAMAMGLPILSTASAVHAPEADYLVEGVDLVTVERSVHDYASRWAAGLSRPTADRARLAPSLPETVGRIVSAVLKVERNTQRRR